MKYYLDSAKLDEIKYAYKFYAIDGVTTNPKHIQASGKPFLTCIKDIANWLKEEGLEGSPDIFPVSVEINPHLDNHEDMMVEARKIAAISKNFVIKIPCNLEGLKAAKLLQEEGINTNVTLVFSASQALQAGRIGAYFVSPFVGWMESSGENTYDYIKDIVDIYNTYGIETEIIVAALRSGKQIVDAARCGADIVTCGLAVYEESFKHPFTIHGLGVFQNAWDNTSKE